MRRFASVLLATLLAAAPAPGKGPLSALDDDLGLPPETAARTLDGELVLSGLSYREVFRLLASRPLLGINLVIAPSVSGLERTAQLELAGLPLGEILRLCLQLTGTRLARAGKKTFVLTNGDDTREFGRRRSAVVRPLRVLPSRVLEFIEGNPAIRRHLDPTRIHADDSMGALHFLARPETVRKLEELVRYLDGRDDKIWVRIPVSFLDEAGLQAAVDALPQADRDLIPNFLYVEASRMVVARGAAEGVKRLQDLVRSLDLPPGQVAVRMNLIEASREALQKLGFTFSTTSVEVESLDDLFKGRTQPSRIGGTLHYLLSRTGARNMGSRTLTIQDGERTEVHLGTVRNVRTGAVSATGPGGTVVSSGGVVEVPLGLQIGVEAVVHHDETATLSLDVAEERVLEIKEFGVDRETFNFTTQVRARYHRPFLITGFASRNRSRTRQTTQSAERRDQRTELALILTLLPDPAGAGRTARVPLQERNRKMNEKKSPSR